MNQEQVKNLLKEINYPGFSRDIVSFGIVKEIKISENQISVNLSIATQNKDHIQSIKSAIESKLSSKTGIVDIQVNFDIQSVKQAPENGGPIGQEPIPGVKHVIAVGSGKGGVGKSTVSINLAAELSKKYKVVVLDLDIYGPSLPMVIGSNEQPKITSEQKLIPVKKFGMKFMSFGFINSDNSATIWRGPMVAKLTTQFFDDVIWGELDFNVSATPNVCHSPVPRSKFRT